MRFGEITNRVQLINQILTCPQHDRVRRSQYRDGHIALLQANLAV